jgi:hypothetical protein
MRHDRLKLVVPENSAAMTDGASEVAVVSAMPGSDLRRLRLVETDDRPFPDDAA